MDSEKMKRVFFLILLIIISGFRYPQKGGEIRISINSKIKNLDPIKYLNDDEKIITKQIFEPLLRIDEKGNPLPNIITDWEINDTGITILVSFREDVRFHNGKKLDSKDVKFSIERFASPAIDSDKKWAFSMLKGFKEFSQGKSSDISGIKIISNDKVIFELIQPYTCFLQVLSTEFGYVIPDKTENLNDPAQIIGCGPFMIEGLDEKNIKLTRNPYYFRGVPFIEKITFSFVKDVFDGLLKFELGDLDLYKIPYSELQRLKNDALWSQNIIEEDRLGFIFIGMNLRSKKIQNLSLRKAVFMAIDKADILKKVTQTRGEIIDWIIPDMILNHPDKTGVDYNLLSARDIIYREGLKPELTLMVVSDNLHLKNIAEIIRTQLKSIDISITVKECYTEEFIQSLNDGKGDIFIFSFDTFLPHSDAVLFPLFHSSCINTGFNLFGFCDKRVDEILNSERQGISNSGYVEVEKYILNQYIILPLFKLQNFWVRQPYIENFYFKPFEGFSFESVWILKGRK
ncbi:MAG: ABC transporter substrate-binding protein [Candidatus Hydrogenedentota bacterium]